MNSGMFSNLVVSLIRCYNGKVFYAGKMNEHKALMTISVPALSASYSSLKKKKDGLLLWRNKQKIKEIFVDCCWNFKSEYNPESEDLILHSFHPQKDEK